MSTQPTDAMMRAGVKAIEACRFHETGDEKIAAEVWRAMQSARTPISRTMDGGGELERLREAAKAADQGQGTSLAGMSKDERRAALSGASPPPCSSDVERVARPLADGSITQLPGFGDCMFDVDGDGPCGTCPTCQIAELVQHKEEAERERDERAKETEIWRARNRAIEDLRP